jgi:hypothetical protein
MTNPEAFAILEDAVRRCHAEDMRTPEVLDALMVLEVQASETWPFDQFRHGLQNEGDTIAAGTGRDQILTASLNGIRRVCAGQR